MNRIGSVRLLAAILGLVCWTQSSCCKFCKQPPPTSTCQTLSISQHDAVGAFMSLGRTQPDAVEVGPTRIRAYNGETVIWTIRNPSMDDVWIQLHDIAQGPSYGSVPLGSVFSSTGGRVQVPKNCGIGFLQAKLQSGLVPNHRAVRDSCADISFHYTFMLYSSPSDSSSLKVGYDPELVVEGKP